MYLKAVEINNFKSFGEKVFIDFNRGITSIVGPNGSGKSNILDAVLWVLGEQSYKNIRAKESQDVIFSGGKEKKAATKAEVSLFIDNQDRYLEIDDDTVKITRKIQISGENEYFINDMKSRLKDIGNLFLDTGIGKTAYSVIGQGKVERIINSSPKEIKNIIEEAAGIKKFQANKIEAVKNLSNTEQELEKVEIILNETRENKNKIEKQAELAQRYIDLRDEKNSLSKAIYLAELDIKSNQYTQALNEKEKSSLECAEIEEELNRKINRLDFIDNEKEEVKKELTLIHSRNTELRDLISSKEKEKAITTERLENFKKEKNNREESFLNLERRFSSKEDEIRNYKETKKNIIVTISEMEKENQDFEEKIYSFEREKENKIFILDSKNAKIRDLELEKLNIINNIENTERRIKSSKNELESYRQDLLETEKKLSVEEEEKENTNKALKEKEIELENIEKRNEFLESELSEISKKINKITENIRNQEYDEKRFSGKLEALIRMDESNEGFHKGVKEVLNSGIKGIEGVLISIIKFDSSLEKAIEAAVPANLQDIIVENGEVAKEAVKFLTNRKLGRASFLALDLIKPNRREFSNKINGVLGLAADLVKADIKYKKVIDFVFGAILIVENINIAIGILNKNLFSGNIVTLSGELVSSRGRITGGENQKSSISQIFERKKEIKDLNERLAILRKQIQNNSDEREKLSEKLEEYENEIENIDTVEANCRKQLNILKEKRINLQDRLDKLTREIAIHKANIEEQENYSKEYENKISLSENEKETIEHHLKMLRDEIQKEEKNLKLIVESIENLNKKFADKRILYLNQKNKIEQLDSDIKKFSRELDEILEEKNLAQDKILKIAEEIENLEKLEADYIEEVEKYTKTFLSENKDIEILTEREQNLSQEERSLSKEKSELETKKLYGNDKLQKLIDLLAKIELEIENIKESLSNLENIEVMQIEIDKIKTYKDKLKNLEYKLNTFGDVNLLAIEEFKELKQKYDFIALQRDDIMKAKKLILDLIQELDETIHDKFYETYNEININFNKMCDETIHNTEGKLNLINQEDFDNCGIEIFVKFKNKKKQPLSLLSGGEKSMVAIAFIMAIFMYKPSPFTFLDEIEAALDEKNTKNLLAKLREFTDKSQFILITHNKDTMKESDSIFGVTMNKEIGISKIVPVKF